MKKYDERKETVGKIASLTFSQSSQREIGGFLASYYLLNHSSLICSHDFSPIYLKSLLNLFLSDSEEFESCLVRHVKGRHHISSKTDDYLHQPI